MRTGVVSELPSGPHSLMRAANEERLVKHFQKMEKPGFAIDKETVKSLAFYFVEKLGTHFRFNSKTLMASYD